jgi:hypothetical protein
MYKPRWCRSESADTSTTATDHREPLHLLEAQLRRDHESATGTSYQANTGSIHYEFLLACLDCYSSIEFGYTYYSPAGHHVGAVGVLGKSHQDAPDHIFSCILYQHLRMNCGKGVVALLFTWTMLPSVLGDDTALITRSTTDKDGPKAIVIPPSQYLYVHLDSWY